jgi:hypothetical protein
MTPGHGHRARSFGKKAAGSARRARKTHLAPGHRRPPARRCGYPARRGRSRPGARARPGPRWRCTAAPGQVAVEHRVPQRQVGRLVRPKDPRPHRAAPIRAVPRPVGPALRYLPRGRGAAPPAGFAPRRLRSAPPAPARPPSRSCGEVSSRDGALSWVSLAVERRRREGCAPASALTTRPRQVYGLRRRRSLQQSWVHHRHRVLLRQHQPKLDRLPDAPGRKAGGGPLLGRYRRGHASKEKDQRLDRVPHGSPGASRLGQNKDEEHKDDNQYPQPPWHGVQTAPCRRSTPGRTAG